MRTSNILAGNTERGLEIQAEWAERQRAAAIMRERFLPPADTLNAEITADLAREDARRAADDDYWRDFDGNS